MWSTHHRHLWAELDALEEPGNVGHLLAVGGFVLADPFEVVLRSLSREYLRAAWRHLRPLLRRRGALPDDLSWGCLHPDETHRVTKMYTSISVPLCLCGVNLPSLI